MTALSSRKGDTRTEMEGDSSEDDTCPFENRLQDLVVYAAHLRIPKWDRCAFLCFCRART